jgi:glycosyltransferase involved in cell wall biosynthesis
MVSFAAHFTVVVWIVVQPLVSVIIPSYNHARYLAATLDSVLAQSWRPLEVIVVDDASTDETSEVLAAYRDRVRTIRLESNSGGPARPRNTAINLARGEYLSFFDSDDLMNPEKLTLQIGFLQRFQDLPLVFSDFENFYADGRVERFLSAAHEAFWQMPKLPLAPGEFRIRSSDAFDTMIADSFAGTSGIVMRRSLVEAVGGFDETLSNTNDQDFLFRVSRKFDLGYVDSVLHRRRMHSTNISSRLAAIGAREVVYERLRTGTPGLSAAAEMRLNRKLADVYFSRGYWERVRGSRVLAVKYYLKSWSLQKTDLWILKSIIRALLPY